VRDGVLDAIRTGARHRNSYKEMGQSLSALPQSLLAVRLILLADVEVYSVFAVGLGCVGV